MRHGQVFVYAHEERNVVREILFFMNLDLIANVFGPFDIPG